MFTIKLYKEGRQRIYSADSFTILRGNSGSAEITIHRKNQGEDFRVDITDTERQEGWPETFDRAIIENAAGKTTEIIQLYPGLSITRPDTHKASRAA